MMDNIEYILGGVIVLQILWAASTLVGGKETNVGRRDSKTFVDYPVHPVEEPFTPPAVVVTAVRRRSK